MPPFRQTITATPLGPALEARRISRSEAFQAAVDALADHLQRPRATVEREATSCLREMVSVESGAATYLYDNLLGPAHTRAFTIDADATALSKLREANEDASLIFLPSHRSYADPFIMTKTLRDHGLRRSHILGGDNLRFFPLGPIARHSGAVFIRRTLGDDETYKTMLQVYLSELLRKGHNLEWYMEGGRSRTGKLRPPKYGLLKYLVRAIEGGAAKDVLLVPTSITYDQLHEIHAMTSFERSGSKPKEGLSWLASYAKMQGKWIGEVHVRFGEPISLADRISQADRSDKQRYLVERVAFDVFSRINASTPVTAQALVTLALLTAGDRALSLHEVHSQVFPMLDYARARSLPTSQVNPLHHHHGVLETLQTLTRTGVVSRFDEGIEPVFRIAPGQHAVAAFYRNSAVHWFVNRAILELAMWKAAHSGEVDLVKAGKHETLALRDLLKFEFFFPDRDGFREELLTESDLFDPEWRGRIATRESRLKMIADAPFLIAHTVLPTFLEAYFIVADRLQARPVGREIDQKAFLDECVAVGQQYVLQQRLRHSECISRELFSNAIRLAENRNLFQPGGADLGPRREAFARECQSAVDAVYALGRLDSRHVSGIAPKSCPPESEVPAT